MQLRKLRVTLACVLHFRTTHAHALTFNANTPIYTYVKTLLCTHTHTSHAYTKAHTYRHARSYAHTLARTPHTFK